ncbi:MAG: DNA starvation/stationary phase protection protein [Terriglobia bacterium]|nr:DNA starvation/stationary phase protection protein [Terriglobia bacterium]
MPTATRNSSSTDHITPHANQHGGEIQKFGTVIQRLSLGLSAEVREEIAEKLNLLLADAITLRDLYKKSHWQVSGPTFYQLHLLFDKHYGEQAELVDILAERVQTLGGVSVAMAHDVAELTRLKRPPRGRQEVPVQIAGLLEAHEQILVTARALAREAADKGDDGTNDLLVSDVVRTNELQVWFISEHLVNMPLVHAGK